MWGFSVALCHKTNHMTNIHLAAVLHAMCKTEYRLGYCHQLMQFVTLHHFDHLHNTFNGACMMIKTVFKSFS